MEASTPAQPVRPFRIIVGSEISELEGRMAAVHKAKDISSGTGRPIRVERKDGLVTMEFRRGKLESYVRETRARRS